jgi:hypothetical protein
MLIEATDIEKLCEMLQIQALQVIAVGTNPQVETTEIDYGQY